MPLVRTMMMSACLPRRGSANLVLQSAACAIDGCRLQYRCDRKVLVHLL